METQIRRSRRTDYDALATLLRWSEISPRTKRMFRRIVADLAYDLYVAESAGGIVGVVGVSYVRSLALGGQRATIEELFVDPARRGTELGARLLAFAVERARGREARVIEARPAGPDAERFVERAGFAARGSRFERSLGDPAA